MQADEVAARRQALNDEAYFATLRALLARGADGALTKVVRLRRQLNISNSQHAAWFQELKAAMSKGPAALEAVRGPSAGGGVVVGAAGSKLPRSASVKSGRNSVGGSRAASARKAKAQQPGAQQGQSSGAADEDRRMVSYKVRVYLERFQDWMEGVITDYQHPNIIVTFHLGEPAAFSEVIKWEQSPLLRMIDETVDLSRFHL